MRRRQASFTLAIGLAAASGWSQTLDEIVARHVEARGGRDKIKALQSVRMTGHVRAGGGRQASVVREVSRPGLIRLEFTVEGVTNVFAFDGTHGWQVSPFFGSFEPEALAPGGEQLAAEQADIEGPLVDWKAKGHRVELVGRETIDGREAYQLKLTLQGGAVLYDCLDAQSLLEVRRRATRTVRGASVEVETTFGDYREVGGLRFPFAIDSVARGRARHLEVTVENVELNPTLDATRFRMPEGALPH
jgi:outer membrane lipoprotein-sorting protein